MLNCNKELWVVTNRFLVQEGSFQEKIEKSMSLGAAAVILREKDLDHNKLKDLAISVKNITDRYKKPLIINGDLQCAVQLEAGGFHIGVETLKNSLEINHIVGTINKHKISHKEFKFGISVHCVEEAQEAQAFGADYLMAGHVFETSCKKGLKGRGVAFIDTICSSVGIPVIAIGGINKYNIKLIEHSRVAGLAMMSQAMQIK